MLHLMDEIDEIDRRLLGWLQRDSRITTAGLAEKVGMSASPSWRRVRRMEDAGIVQKYVVLLDPRKLGLNAVAYVHVSLFDHTEATIAKFNDFIQRQVQVVECASITGSSDFMLKVYARTPEDLEVFLMRKLLALGIVRSSTTNFVLRQTKYTTELPLD